MKKEGKIILSTAYFPPIYYFSKLLNANKIYIEQNEHYSKQSYRNRCDILSPNGKQSLSIPVKKHTGVKQIIKNVKIDYKNDWQSLHLKSIKTAYLSSPFFEFYIDAFMPFFEKKFTYLFDFNKIITETILNEIQIIKAVELTNSYQQIYDYGDFRESIHPKNDQWKNDLDFKSNSYTQVFYKRFEFIPNLSILDLLFNEGPNVTAYL